MIGDKPSDAEAGTAAGCRSIMVRTGHGIELPPEADAVDDLATAVLRVVRSLRERS